MQEKRDGGGFTYHEGVLLFPMSWYHNIDVWTLLKLMIMIEHMKMMQISYLDIWQCLFLGKCLIGAIQVNYFGMVYYSRKANKQGRGGAVEDILFWKKPWIFFVFFSVPLEIPAKQSSIPGNLVKLCMLHPWKTSRPEPRMKITYNQLLLLVGSFH